jgi:hypothetical protein
MTDSLHIPSDVKKAYHYGIAIHASGEDGAKGASIWVAAELYDFNLIPGIVSGKHRGLSPTLDVKRFDCSICGLDIEVCPHDVGKEYGGELCSPVARGIDAQSIDLVDRPKDPKAFITDLLLVTRSKRYYWYGFPAETENERFRNIQSAYETGKIPEPAANHFVREFSMRFLGLAVWP